jgi:AcrR family transcriptional regulator
MMQGTPTTTAAKRSDESKPRKRAYRMESRAEAAEATKDRILGAAVELFKRHSYDEVGLEAVAARAGVSLPTILRKFGSKAALFIDCGRDEGRREFEARTFEPGDVRGIVCMLAGRYGRLMPMWSRYIGVEQRFPAVSEVLGRVRQDHLEWLAQAFAPVLPRRRGSLHARRVAQLFGATEIYLWWTWREHLGFSEREAHQCMLEMVESLVDGWSNVRKEPE